ncbi:radical SAM protein [Polaribacter sp. Z022]|uniref:B12-binding domain-containing radical SAM protein n=1 Tax=Polaribacter sp. Z022 TaxID=2927125 RepID=UPI002020FEE3|nr:radical SAM protein [Polaribacter sp. Z022]MCL7752138.1 B12-binding domain-containing radical SAM protein [Polaribacter sp. Z022]
MKVYLIKASAGSEYSKYKAETGGPPQNIFSAAATTPKNVEIEMCDETIGMKTDFNSDADIIAVFMSTPDAFRAYEIADKFSEKGKTIVLGGLHTYFMQEEASKHADTILIGEIEGIWEQLLEDFKKGVLKKSYKRDTVFNLKDLKPYPTNYIHPKHYNYTWSVVVSRGCPFKCDFCLVHKFFKKFQLRPIENIVSELKHLKEIGVEWVELHSDNLTQDKEYAIALFEAIAPLKMNFFGETTIMIARDERLLEAAEKAGVKALLFGIETPSEKALKDQGKSFVKPNKIKEYVKIIKKYNIEVVGDFLFGFDAHDTSIFEETLNFVKDINADKVYPHLVIPFPGSDTFNRLETEGRILTKDWSKYEGSNAVYQPLLMSPQDLEEGLMWFWYKNASFSDKVKFMFS